MHQRVRARRDPLHVLATAVRTFDARGALASSATEGVRWAVAALVDSDSVPDHPAQIFGRWEDLPEEAREAFRKLTESEITRSMDFHPSGRIWPALVRTCWSLGKTTRRRGGPARLARAGERWAMRFWKAPDHLRSRVDAAFHRFRFRSARSLHAADLLAALGRKPSWLLGDYAKGVEEDPRARGFCYDPSRHVAWGYLLGLDLIPAPDGYWCIEANLDTGAYQDWGRGIWNIGPAVGAIFRAAKGMGFERVWWHAMDLSAVSPWLLGQLREKGENAGMGLIVREDFKVPSRTDFAPGQEAPSKHLTSPIEVPSHTLVLRRNEYQVGSDRVLSHKGLFIRGLDAELRAAGETRCRTPAMTRVPRDISVPTDEGLPNLVYKYPDSSKAEGVFFLRVANEARAMKLAREIDAETGEPPGLFQPFVCSRILPGRRLYDIRCEILLTPLGAKALYAMRREATNPLPVRLDEGRVQEKGVFHANMSTGGEIIQVSPRENKEIFVAADAVGEALVRLLRKGFGMGGPTHS